MSSRVIHADSRRGGAGSSDASVGSSWAYPRRASRGPENAVPIKAIAHRAANFGISVRVIARHLPEAHLTAANAIEAGEHAYRGGK